MDEVGIDYNAFIDIPIDNNNNNLDQNNNFNEIIIRNEFRRDYLFYEIACIFMDSFSDDNLQINLNAPFDPNDQNSIIAIENNYFQTQISTKAFLSILRICFLYVLFFLDGHKISINMISIIIFLLIMLIFFYPCFSYFIYISYCNIYNKIITNHKLAKQLKSITFKEYLMNTKEKIDDVGICIICTEEFKKNDSVINLKCNTKHVFHENCIKQWIGKKAQCPICRFDLTVT